MAKSQKANLETLPFTGKLEDLIIQLLIEKKGENIISIDLKKINHVFFDYFIICTGNSKTHIETLVDFVQASTKKQAKIPASYISGLENGEWVILDYFNIIVHIFQPDIRKFYNLEQLWSDAPIQQFN